MSERQADVLTFLEVKVNYLMYSHLKDEGFEVLTAVVTKTSVVWDIMQCSPLEISRRVEEYVASIFRVEEVTSMKHVASRAPASIAMFASFYVIVPEEGGRNKCGAPLLSAVLPYPCSCTPSIVSLPHDFAVGFMVRLMTLH
jgi:hypothetical protein